MTIGRLTKFTAACVTLLALVACSSTSRQATAPSNPYFFLGRVSMERLPRFIIPQ